MSQGFYSIELIFLLLLFSKAGTVLFCKKVGKKLLSYGFYIIGVIYSSVALHIRTSNLIF